MANIMTPEDFIAYVKNPQDAKNFANQVLALLAETEPKKKKEKKEEKKESK